MICRNRCRGFVIAASICTFVVASGGTSVRAADNERKIREALAKPTAIQFNETSLKDVVQFWQEQHAINIRINQKSLEEANVQLDTPITYVLKGVSFASGLDLVLRPLGVTYVIEHEVLLITSLDDAQRASTPRVYDVTALAAEPEREAVLKAVALVLDRPAAIEGATPVTTASRMLLFRNKLMLRGSQPEHDRVAELLTKLREPPKPTAVEPAAPPKETSRTPRKRIRKAKLPLAVR